MKIKAIIFDLDGVLIDSTEWHYEALNKALGLFGFNISRAEHETVFNGLPTKTKLQMLGLSPAVSTMVGRMKKLYTRQLIDERLVQDYQKIMLLRQLREKYVIGCASNAMTFTVQETLRKSNLALYIDHVIGADQITEPKPSPMIYTTLIKKMELTPSKCVIVEDALYGIKSARASGAQVIAVGGYKEVNSVLFSRQGLL